MKQHQKYLILAAAISAAIALATGCKTLAEAAAAAALLWTLSMTWHDAKRKMNV